MCALRFYWCVLSSCFCCFFSVFVCVVVCCRFRWCFSSFDLLLFRVKHCKMLPTAFTLCLSQCDVKMITTGATFGDCCWRFSSFSIKLHCWFTSHRIASHPNESNHKVMHAIISIHSSILTVEHHTIIPKIRLGAFYSAANSFWQFNMQITISVFYGMIDWSDIFISSDLLWCIFFILFLHHSIFQVIDRSNFSSMILIWYDYCFFCAACLTLEWPIVWM